MRLPGNQNSQAWYAVIGLVRMSWLDRNVVSAIRVVKHYASSLLLGDCDEMQLMVKFEAKQINPARYRYLESEVWPVPDHGNALASDAHLTAPHR